MIGEGPVALVGRADALAGLSDGFDSGLRRFILTGPAGVGKSALAHALADRLKARQGLVGFGKHGVGESGAAPLLRAMRTLIEAALEELFEPSAGLEQLRATMGPAQPLFDALMLGRETLPTRAQRADAMIEQLAQVFERCFAWLAGFGVPLALLIDDWDRASAEVVGFYLRIVDLSRAHPVCLIATGRTWPGHADEGRDDLLSLQLAGLDPEARRALLVSSLGEADGTAVDAMIPAAVDRPLELIRRADAVAAQIASGRSVADPEALAAALQDDLPALVSARLRAMPVAARDLALLLAALGDSADTGMARMASGLAPQAFDSAVALLVADRILVRSAETVGSPHDTLRAAVAEFAVRHDAAATIAHAAARRLQEQEQADAAWPMAVAALLLAHPPGASDPAWVAPLSIAASGALRSLDMHRAARLAELALAMSGGLAGASIETLRLRAVTAMAEGDLAMAGQCAEQLRRLSTSRADIASAYALSADLARAQGERGAAIAFALTGHRKLGWAIADAPSRFATLRDILWTNLIGNVLRALPLQARTPDVDILKLCAATSTVFYEYGTPHVVSVARHFALSRETRGTSAGLSAAVFMANFLKRNRMASRLGDKVLGLESSGEPQWPTSAYRAQFFGRLWTRPARSFRPVHDSLHARAVAEGDIPVAAWLLRHKAHLAWRAGEDLAAIERMADEAAAFARRVGNQTSAAAAAQIALATRMLRGLPTDPAIAIDPYCPHTLETPLLTWMAYHNYRGDFAQTMELLSRLPRKPSISLASHPGIRDFQFHRAVAMLATSGRAWPEDVRGLARAAALCPDDHRARLQIVHALVARQRGKLERGLRLATQAVQACAALQRPHDESLAGFVAADLAAMLGREADRAVHFDRARRAWAAWGARADGHVRLARLAGAEQGQDLRQLTERLEQSERENRAKSRLLALVGHELRTPLQAMAGAVDLIQVQGGKRDDLGIVTASIDRLSAMVDDLSAVTALEAGELAVHPRAFALAALLRQVVNTHAVPLRAAGMTLSLDVAQHDQSWLWGDDKRLQQILDNLLNNARKYGAGAVLLKLSREGDIWHFEVGDQGPGLMPDQALRIFEPFVRGASPGAVPGHGIGLWLARKLAENMGGTLALAPAEGDVTGARFVLTLPLEPAQPPVRSPERASSEAPARRVILVEDEPLSRDVITRMLEHDGHRVSAFAAGQAAIDRLQAAEAMDGHDVALVDGNLPDLTGLATADWLRDLSGAAPLTIILMTAQVTDAHVQAQQAGRIDRVVQKPITMATIRALLGETRAAPDPLPDAAHDPAAIGHLRAYFGAICQEFEHQRWAQLEAAAHKLAGAAMTLDMAALGERGLALESAARARDSESAAPIIAQMEHLLAGFGPAS